MENNIPEVLIVGRPNVGKSTLFNRLSGKALALVDDRPGTTRDLKSTVVEWGGRAIRMTDSGGWLPDDQQDHIAEQVGRLIAHRGGDVDLLLMMVDGRQGITTADRLLVRHMREKGRPVLLVVNKADRQEDREAFIGDFHKLGIEHTVAISAAHGIGLDDLLDLVVEKTPEKKAAMEDPNKPFKIAVLGKPNVGKSSILNALIGQNLLVVDDTPGTTHDAIPVVLEVGERDLVMVDTAGIRAPKQVESRVEKLSIDQALYELQTCQVALLVLDGEKGIAHQDVTLCRVLREAFRPVVVVVNKWDIHPKGAEQAWAEKTVHHQLRHLDYAPVLFISAKNRMGLEKVVPMARRIYEESCRRIPTASFNRALQEAVNRQAPPFRKGNRVKPLYGFQRQGHPPAFEVYANHPECAVPSYVRYLEESLRQAFDLRYTPLQLVFKAKLVPKGKKRRHPPKRKGF
jgi:GTP-binding protein